MYKMVIQAVMFTAAALCFIVFKSDNLRNASRSGDLTALVDTSVASKYADIDMSGPDPIYNQSKPFYDKLDPRKLWKEKPKKARLNVKTIKAPTQSAAQSELAKKLKKDGLSEADLRVVKLK